MRAHLRPARLALLLELELLLGEELPPGLGVKALAVAPGEALGAREGPRLVPHLVLLLQLQGLLERLLLLLLLPHERRRLRLQVLGLLAGCRCGRRLLALQQVLRLLRQQRPWGRTAPACTTPQPIVQEHDGFATVLCSSTVIAILLGIAMTVLLSGTISPE